MLISIIIPCYNQAQYLDECLLSVSKQTYKNWECIIVNDGSFDNTESIIKKWIKKDTRFKYIYKENEGRSSARNIGLENAKGKWIQFLDADDILFPQKLYQQINKATDNEELIVCNFYLLKKGKRKPPFCYMNKYKFNLKNIILFWDEGFNIPIHSALFLRKSLQNIRFNEQFHSKEDWIFWIDFFIKKRKTKFINEHLVYYRVNPKTLGNNTLLINKANSYIFKNYNLTVKSLLFEKINATNLKLHNIQRHIFVRIFLKLKKVFTK